MQRKSRACFASHDEWLAYVRRELSRDEQPTALAYGRMELFLRFLELRGQSLPAELKAELDLILGLPDPDRADQLDTLNDRIMAHLIEVLFAEAGPTLDAGKAYKATYPATADTGIARPSGKQKSVLPPLDRLQRTRQAANSMSARGTNSSVVSWARMTQIASISLERWRSWIGFLSGPMTTTLRCRVISSSALGSFISCVSRKEWSRRAPF